MNPAWLRWPQTQSLVKAFGAQPGSLRFVGGAVRDALLEREVQDVDAATTLAPDAAMELMEKSGIRVIPTGIAHGTVTAVINGKSFEITTLRKDTACDGRHAKVEYTSDWEADAKRRDFTMNALYLTPEGELFDYTGGETDAKAGRVRFIGDAAARIEEDYLRILRFFRFHAHYGKGEPDADALAACAAQGAHIAGLSGERIQHELCKLLAAPRASATLDRMQSAQLMAYMLGFAVEDCSVLSRLEAIAVLEGKKVPFAVSLVGFILKAAIRREDALLKLASRLRLSNQTEHLMRLVAGCMGEVTPQMSESEQKRLIRALGAVDFSWVVMAQWACGTEAVDKAQAYHAMIQRAATWQVPTFPLRGEDLVTMGMKPGKDLGELLRRLEDAWEASGYTLSKEELLTRVRV